MVYRLSASCTHVSGLLHALVAMCPSSFQTPAANFSTSETEEEILPITSYACQWKPPRKRKQSTLKMSEATFQKHVYGQERKRSFKPLEDFDPRPTEYRNTAQDQLTEMLSKIRGKGLCVSLMLDPACQYWQESSSAEKQLPPELPSKVELQERVQEFKKSLIIPAQKLREIEQTTRDQSLSTLWHSIRRYRITASYFGEVRRRLPTTPPQSLVLRMLGARQFKTPATEWGKEHEELALVKYQDYQHASGHENLHYSRSGFVISEDFPFLGASPDAVVYDPISASPFGLAEVKCPYSFRHMTPSQACMNREFCCVLEATNDGKEHLKLRHNHPYYSQVQGQMAITGRAWCDFVIYTEKGISVERISFNRDFWQTDLLPKLIDFFDNCFAPEIISPIHVLGLPVRDLRNM